MPWKVTPAPSDRELIRRYLGHAVTDQSLNNIQTRMNDVELIGGEDVVLTVQAYLAQLSVIQASIQEARSRAGVADEAIADEDTPTDKSYYRGEQIKTDREEARRLVREVSETLGLPVYRDVFAISVATATYSRS